MYGIYESIFSYLQQEELLYISLINKEYEKVIKNTYVIYVKLLHYNKLDIVQTIFPKSIIKTCFNVNGIDYYITFKNTNVSLFKNQSINLEILKNIINLNISNYSDTNLPSAVCNFEVTDETLKCLTNLESLTIDIDVCKITDEGFKYLSNLKKLHLHLFNCKITHEGFKYLTNLKELIVFKSITDKMLKPLCNLKILKMYFCNKVTNKGLKYLVNLESLGIYGGNNITKIQGLKNLKHLYLNTYGVFDDGLKDLINLEKLIVFNSYDLLTNKIFNYLPNLKILGTNNCTTITDEGIQNLIDVVHRGLQPISDQSVTERHLPQLISLNLNNDGTDLLLSVNSEPNQETKLNIMKLCGNNKMSRGYSDIMNLKHLYIYKNYKYLIKKGIKCLKDINAFNSHYV